MNPKKVFISYSHDTPEHTRLVRQLANALRGQGVDAELNQYHVRPALGWPRWCEEQLRPENADFVLVICTRTYRQRVEGQTAADEGRGVFWEGGIIYSYLYNEKGNQRFIPVLLPGATPDDIPLPLRDDTRYHVEAFDLSDPGYRALYRELTRQLASKNWPGCAAALAWSFYSQGARDHAAASSDTFFKEALTFFGDPDMANSAADVLDKGRRLARLVGERRALLILDGLEPLQYAPGSPTPGELKDPGLAALLKGLAAASQGLCVVTTRYSIPDLAEARRLIEKHGYGRRKEELEDAEAAILIASLPFAD